MPRASHFISNQRDRELDRLAAFWPHELADKTPKGRETIITRLEGMLAREWQALKDGAWNASQARHDAVFSCLKRERAQLQSLKTPVSESGHAYPASLPLHF